MLWEKLSDEAQIYKYWEYCANIPDYDEAPISFSEFSEMMTGFVF